MTSRKPEIAQEVLALVSKRIDALARLTLDSNTLLRSDLGFEQEEALALIKELHERFGLSGEIELERYFNGFEARIVIPEFSAALRLMFADLNRRWREDPPRPDISVGHLIEVTQSTLWSDPPPLPPFESYPWVGQRFMPFFRMFSMPIRCLGYLFAIGLIYVFSSLAIETVYQALIERSVPLAALSATVSVLPIFFVILMSESTQRRIVGRFGRRWDWRRCRLRDPKKVRIGASP